MSNNQNIDSPDNPFQISLMSWPQGVIYFDDCDVTKIHIRIIKRNARKSITTVEGLDTKLDLKKMIKHLRHKFNCSGKIVSNENASVLQFSGDQRDNIRDFLIKEEIADKDSILVHGY